MERKKKVQSLLEEKVRNLWMGVYDRASSEAYAQMQQTARIASLADY